MVPDCGLCYSDEICAVCNEDYELGLDGKCSLIDLDGCESHSLFGRCSKCRTGFTLEDGKCFLEKGLHLAEDENAINVGQGTSPITCPTGCTTCLTVNYCTVCNTGNMATAEGTCIPSTNAVNNCQFYNSSTTC